MINLTILNTVDDLLAITGAPDRTALWKAGFNLDDWAMCFVSNQRLITPCEEFDEEGYPEYEAEPVSDAYWLVRQMECYCCGYEETEYNNKWYYIVYHS